MLSAIVFTLRQLQYVFTYKLSGGLWHLLSILTFYLTSKKPAEKFKQKLKIQNGYGSILPIYYGILKPYLNVNVNAS